MTRDEALKWFDDLLLRGDGLLRPGGTLGTHYDPQELAAWTNEVASAIATVFPPNHAIALRWEPTVKKVGSSGINFRGAIKACIGVVEAARNLIRDRRLPSLVDGTSPAAPTPSVPSSPPPSSQVTQVNAMITKPHVFIGSSTEGLAIAKVIQLELEHSAECVIWSQGVFGLSEGTLESLVKAAETFQYAILVLTPDDLKVTRGESKNSPRDNVVFELGLFMGSLGRDRTFIVHSRSSPIDLPSDLAGITTLAFNSPQKGNLQSALGPACTRIEQELGKHRSPLVRPSRTQAEEPSEFPIELWMNSKPMSQGDAMCIVDPSSGGRMGKIHIAIENRSTQTLDQESFSIAAITPKSLRTMDLGFTVSPLPDGTLQHVVHGFPRIFQGQFREFEMVPDWSEVLGKQVEIKVRVYTNVGSRDFPLQIAVANTQG